MIMQQLKSRNIRVNSQPASSQSRFIIVHTFRNIEKIHFYLFEKIIYQGTHGYLNVVICMRV